MILKSLLKSENKNDTYIQEFVPDNLQKESLDEEDLRSKDSEDEIHSSKTSPRETPNLKSNVSVKNILKK